jgi:hypothetical protein
MEDGSCCCDAEYVRQIAIALYDGDSTMLRLFRQDASGRVPAHDVSGFEG